MRIKNFERELKTRIFVKNIISILIAIKIVLVVFGTAGMIFYYDSIFNDKPEYFKHFDDKMYSFKDSISKNEKRLKELLNKQDSTNVVNYKLGKLTAEIRGIKNSIDGYTEEINKNRNNVINSFLSSKRALVITLSIFLIFYIKFLAKIYIHNTDQASRGRAILDSLELSKQMNNGKVKIDMEVFKEFIVIFDLPFNQSRQQDLNIETLINKASKL